MEQNEVFNVDNWLEKAPQPLRAQFYKVMQMSESERKAEEAMIATKKKLSFEIETHAEIQMAHKAELVILIEMLRQQVNE